MYALSSPPPVATSSESTGLHTTAKTESAQTDHTFVTRKDQKLEHFQIHIFSYIVLPNPIQLGYQHPNTWSLTF
jgi:hypothetical protein